jgi:hypothetical protein
VRIGLVGCVKTKLAEPAPAAELYVSDLFRGRRRVVETTCDRWFILSAMHGLVAPETVLDPYDAAMSELGRVRRRWWSVGVIQSLEQELGGLDGHFFEIHAGADYVDFGLQRGLERAGARVERPVEGLSLGEQLAWYQRGSRRLAASTPVRADAVSGSRARGRYGPLADYLASRSDRSLTLRFGDIEQIISGALPRSAHDHRPWWANSGNTQAQGWLRAGYEVDTVDLRGEWVRFRKVGA